MCREVVSGEPRPAGFEGVLALQPWPEDGEERVRGPKSPPRSGRGAERREESNRRVHMLLVCTLASALSKPRTPFPLSRGIL